MDKMVRCEFLLSYTKSRIALSGMQEKPNDCTETKMLEQIIAKHTLNSVLEISKLISFSLCVFF